MIILDLSPFPKILKPGGHYLLVLLIIDFLLLETGQVAADGEEVMCICNCLGRRIVEGRVLKGKGKEENVVDSIPSKLG